MVKLKNANREGYLYSQSLKKWIPTPLQQLREKGHLFHKDQKRNMVRLNDGTKIYNNKRFLKKDYKITDVYGFDSETYKGQCKLLCRSNGQSDFILDPSFMECLDFLFYNASLTNIWRFFYNIDFDYNAIIKTLPLNNFFVKLMINMLNDGIEVQFGKYKITYIKGIMLILRKNKKRVVFTDLFRIFRISLNEASIEFLKNEQKYEIDGNKLNTDLSYWNENIDDIIKYCIQDCNLLKKLGLIFLDYLKEAKISIPKYLCSPASLSKQHFRRKCFMTPIFPFNPLEVVQIAYDTYYGGRFELLKRGTFEKMYNYDINSEYPEIIAKLPSLKYGLWLYHKNLEKLPKKECFGYFKAKVLIPDWNLISTIPIRKGTIRFPNGIFEKWFTWYDLDLMRDYIIEIKEAYIYSPSKREYYPFKETIKQLYKLKSKWKNKNKIMYMIYKLTMNALYGCFFEIHNNKLINGTKERVSGILFHPIYASQITSFGRWKIIKPIWKVKDKIIGFHTDSILSEIPLDKYLDIGKGLGQWTFETSGKGYIINTGMYQINGKVKIIKTRGIPLSYINDWFKFAEQNKDLTYKEFDIKRMTKLGQSLREYKNLDMINIMKDNKKSVNINSDKKRHWFRKFDNFQDTLQDNIESLPYIYCFDDLLPNPLCI